jgi:hypothetical protein
VRASRPWRAARLLGRRWRRRWRRLKAGLGLT